MSHQPPANQINISRRGARNHSYVGLERADSTDDGAYKPYRPAELREHRRK